jgi:UDP-N-acetylglucosamine 4-epimerase
LQLAQYLKEISQSAIEPKHILERAGDVKHSLADISKAKNLLGYDPTVPVEVGLKQTYKWYEAKLKSLAQK